MATAASKLKNPPARIGVIRGCLLGMAVGDALGLPREGLTPQRGRKLFGDLRHCLVLGRGMVSDDTEHACMTAQALLVAGEDVERFRRSLAWRLRFWLLSIPAGIGWGTLRSIGKLWMGVPPARSGVASAGNGPAMRAPMIGVLLADRPASLVALVQASTQITHREPRAEQGALAIALAAAYAAGSTANGGWREALESIRQGLTEPELLELLDRIACHLEEGASPESLAGDLGLSRGVSGYIYHTVPMALFCWLRYLGDFRSSVEAAVRLGGDTDTVAGITGALAGISASSAGIPRPWLAGLIEWPRSVPWMEALASRLARQFPEQGAVEIVGAQPFFWPGQLLRNVLFTTIVLGHGFRRLLPPY